MDKSIKVNILNRDYPLKVAGNEEEEQTREFANYVDERLKTIQQGLGSVPELTVAVIGALSLGEELFEARRKLEAIESGSPTTASAAPVASFSEDFAGSIKELSSTIQTVLEKD